MVDVLALNVLMEGLESALRSRHAGEAEAVLVRELGLCQGRGRIDLAVVGEELHGYEVKSDFDSLRRLPEQVALYGKVFDRVTLVCGDKHLGGALELVPRWWGVLRALPDGRRGGVIFRAVRKGRRNRSREARALAEFIWRGDAAVLLDGVGSLGGLRKSARGYLWDRLSEVLTLDEMGEAVRSHLRETVLNRGRGVLVSRSG